MATETTNYKFPKYEAGDIPNLLDEYNEFADKADAAIHNAMMAASNAGTAAQNAQQQAQAASTKADDVEDTVNTMSTQVNTALNTANDAMSLAQTNESDIADIETDVTQLQTGKAPTDHSSNQSTYGLGNGTEYGHVKLEDSPVNMDANSGTAATPQCVSTAMSTATSNAVSETESRNSLAGYKLNSVTSGFADSAVVSGTVKIITHNGAGCINVTQLNVNNTQASIRWVNVVYLDTYGFQFTGSPEITNTIMTTDGVNNRQMRIVNSGGRPVLQISMPNNTNWTLVGQVSFIYTTAGARALAEGISTLADADDDTMYILG